MNVLIVDDDPMILKTLKRCLKPYGFSVVTAEGVADAFKKLHLEAFDLVLSDIDMPDGTGFDLATQIRDHGSVHMPPFIFMTGQRTKERFERAADEFSAPLYDKLKDGLITIAATVVDVAKTLRVFTDVCDRCGCTDNTHTSLCSDSRNR